MTKTSSTLGSLIRRSRAQKGWSLRAMSAEVGIPLSTLAKVEADKLSLSYDKIQQLSLRMGMTMADFLSQGEVGETALTGLVTGRRSVVDDHNVVEIETENYNYRYLCADLTNKRMVPILVTVRARTLTDFGSMVSHRGEEFIYVLEGTVEVHTRFYKPITLAVGKGVYLDSTMEHAYVAVGDDPALILAVCSDDGLQLDDELIALAAREAPPADAAVVSP